MGAAKVPIAYEIRNSVDDNYIFEDKGEKPMHQMPLTGGENFKRENKLVYNMLKAAGVKKKPGPGFRTMTGLRMGAKLGRHWSSIMTEPVNSTNKWKGQRRKFPACTIRMKRSSV